MRTPIKALDKNRYDVVVIGAGVNGASAAQHLAAAGYTVLLVDKDDFGAGSSSRSSRLLHCGLRYLAPGDSMAEFLRHPTRLATALRMARQAMWSRSQFVRTTPERARSMKFHFPVYDETPYAPWQVTLAFKVLQALGPKDLPLDYIRLSARQAAETPLLGWLRDLDKLRAIIGFREYQFDWPERVALDAVLDAERMGATVRNHTAVTGMTRQAGDSWSVRLGDRLGETGEAVVRASMVLNMAGIWIDRVNQHSDGAAGRKITGTKGVHIMLQLPPECREYGIATINRLNEPFYCVPWRGLHYVGPTETLYDGDIDEIRPGEAEIEGLLDEASHLLPGAGLQRDDVLFAWAGVRPLTYDPELPMGARSREIHDLAADGLPNVLAMTAGPVMTHRSGGETIAAAVAQRIAPSGALQALSYAARSFPFPRTRTRRRSTRTTPKSSSPTCATPPGTSIRRRWSICCSGAPAPDGTGPWAGTWRCRRHGPWPMSWAGTRNA
jgi:glycerol-3-phosphate dehydrogenase